MKTFIENISIALATEIRNTTPDKLTFRNIKKEDGLLYCETQLTLNDGEGELVVGGKRYNVNVSTKNGHIYFEGADIEESLIKEATLVFDDSKLLIKIAEEFKTYKPSDLMQSMFSPKGKISATQYTKAGLNAAQNNAVGRALNEDYLAVVGPGGTGKTTTINVLIDELLAKGKRVAVASPANLAVQNVFKDRHNLDPDEVVLGISTDIEHLTELSVRAKAEKRAKEIRDQLDVIEPALKKLLALKAELCATVDPAEEVIASSELSASNLAREIRVAEKEIKELEVEKARLENRLAKIAGNSILASLTLLVTSDKKDDLEAQIAAINEKLADKNTVIAANNEKVLVFEADAKQKLAEIADAKQKLAEVNRQGKIAKEQYLALKAEMSEVDSFNPYKDAKLAGITLFSAATNKKIAQAEFDVLIVDEASMANLPTLLLASNIAKEKVIYFGDPMQLPPICKTKGSELEKSIFDVLGITESFLNGVIHEKAAMLDIQFRYHSQICKFVSEFAYGGLLKHGKTEVETNSAMFIKNVIHNDPRYVEEKGYDRASNTNRKHLTAVLDTVGDALSKMSKKGEQKSIGVVCPYKAQAAMIQKAYDKKYKADYPNIEFRAATIHKFQGQEMDIVIFDLVYGYSHNGTEIPEYLRGDMSSKMAKLLNVATTRAKEFFVVVCDLKYTHNAIAKLPNGEDQALSKWLNGIEDIAFRKTVHTSEDLKVA